MQPRVAAYLRERGLGASLHISTSVDQALALLRQWPAGSRVVLAGGDGSLHRMLPALLERGHSLALLLTGLHRRHPRVGLHAFAALRIRSSPPLPLAADGEALPDAVEFQVSVRPGALAVVRRPG